MKRLLFAGVLLAGLMRMSAADSQPISVRVGEQFKITLQYNSTTGYSWSFPKPLDEKLVKLVHTDYGRANPKVIGSGGDETWTFQALAEGKTQIELGYVRPWEKGVKPAQSTNFVIIIKPAKTETNKAAPPT